MLTATSPKKMSSKTVEMKKNIEKKMIVQREGHLTTEKLRKGHYRAAEKLLTPCSDSSSSVLTLTAGIPSSINILFSKALMS